MDTADTLTGCKDMKQWGFQTTVLQMCLFYKHGLVQLLCHSYTASYNENPAIYAS